MNKKTIIFVFGTRPELIKMIPLILEAKKIPELQSVVCSTGQHKDMLESLYNFFNIKPDIDFKLMKPNQSLINLHSETMTNLISVMSKYKPNWLVVQGDTTSAHAAAMAAFYNKVDVAHVEAGLRTYDIHSPFPEEMNRRAIGLVAKAHFCPTNEAAANLKREITDVSSFIEVTGNTGLDTLNLVSEKIEENVDLKNQFLEFFSYLNLNNFILATMHRRENFGSAQQEILRAFLTIVKKHKIDMLFPVHPNPNVRKSVEEIFSSEMDETVFWMDASKSHQFSNKNQTGKIFLIDPLDYPALVFAMKKSRFVMTDSGGLQEEAPSFAKKILVLRNSTERPEGVAAGFSELVGTDYNKITQAADKLIASEKLWTQAVPKNPYGDGKSAQKILKILLR